MHSKIMEIIAENSWTVSRVAIEYAEFRSGSVVGHAAAARGNLTDLCMAAGYHLGAFGIQMVCCDLIPVSEWKGQLKKEMTTDRIHRVLGKVAADGTYIESHAADAVGIGLHALGVPMDSPLMAKS
jgi:hypothetical protein